MGSECCVYSPVVAWLVSWGCLAKFGVARSRFVVLMQCSVTHGKRTRFCLGHWFEQQYQKTHALELAKRREEDGGRKEMRVEG